jgi:hypothetical protein
MKKGNEYVVYYDTDINKYAFSTIEHSAGEIVLRYLTRVEARDNCTTYNQLLSIKKLNKK